MTSSAAVVQPPPFPYAPLDQEQRLIRILCLLPALDTTAPIRCRLEHVLLEAEDVSYEALSYTWGSGEKTDEIEMDGRPFRVTSNLFSALRMLRSQEGNGYFWIDAICINQDDLAERSREVLRMLLIYQRAQQVVVWLGDEENGSDLAMAHLRALGGAWSLSHGRSWSKKIIRVLLSVILNIVAVGASLVAMVRYRPYLSTWELLFLLGWLPAMPYWILQMSLRLFCWYTTVDCCYFVLVTYRRSFAGLANKNAQPDQDVVESLKHFFGRSWFQRAWIVQEIAAARDVTIVCGWDFMSWQTFVNACDEIYSRVSSAPVKSAYTETRYLRGGALRRIVSRAAATDTPSKTDLEPVEPVHESAKYLVQLLHQFRYCDATDPRDKMYSLLGLAFRPDESHPGQEFLVPDYSKSTAEVFSDLARSLIVRTGKLDILRYCQGYRKVPGLPSWAPDWTCKGLSVPSTSYLTTKGYTIPGLPELPPASFSDDGKTLVAQGFVIGHITQFNQILFSSKPDAEDIRQKVPGLALSALRYFILMVIWLVQLRLSKIAVWLLKASLRRIIVLVPKTAEFLNFVLVVLDEITEAIAADDITPKRNESRRKVIDNETYTSGFNFPVAVDNMFGLAYASDDNFTNRGFDWEVTLSNPFIKGLEFETAARDPQLGDLICLLVGCGDAYILRPEGDHYTLVGFADLGMSVRWYWKDCLREFEEGTLPLETIPIM